jgi:hypothetical protein
VPPYAHPQRIKVLKHFVYICHKCGKQSVRVCSLNHDITTSLGIGLSSIFLKSTSALHRRNSVSVHPYAHPQHIKVLKHCVYIWHGCGMHSKRVCSLNHDITTSLGLGLSSIFLKSTPALHRCNSVRVHPYAYPQHIKVLKHCVYIWHGCGKQSVRVCSLNHDITTSLGLGLSSIFLKSTPALHRCNSVRVHPYAHPRHIKVLKHCVYIWHGCGKQSVRVCSLNHDITTSGGGVAGIFNRIIDFIYYI